jgi:hypothetical protein
MNEQNGGSQNTQFKCVKEEHPDNQQSGGDNLDYMDEVPKNT